jgi:hypothetical protein
VAPTALLPGLTRQDLRRPSSVLKAEAHHAADQVGDIIETVRQQELRRLTAAATATAEQYDRPALIELTHPIGQCAQRDEDRVRHRRRRHFIRLPHIHQLCARCNQRCVLGCGCFFMAHTDQSTKGHVPINDSRKALPGDLP